MSFMQSIAREMTKSTVTAVEAQKQEWQETIDAISDPLAKEIEWTPLMRWGSSFRTHIIVQDITNGNLELRATKFPKLLSGFFIGLGLLIDIIILLGLLESDSFDPVLLLLFLGPSLFVIGWILAYRYFSKSIVFDRQNGYFYRGKPKMTYGIIDPNDKKMVPLSSIHAIQVVWERVYAKNSNFTSYEINLVLEDWERANVVDYGNLETIRTDAKRLGEYLGVPVWGV